MKKILILFFLAIFLSPVFADSSHGASIGEWTKLKKGYVIAASKELFDKAVDILISKDEQAFLKLVSTGLVMLTNETMEVYVVDVHPFGGTAEVRFRGDTSIWWTNIEAIGYGN